jgi:5-deoxy-glucuronate isomerase
VSGNWFRPLGQASEGKYSVAVRPGIDAWENTGLLIAMLQDGERCTISTGPDEYIVLPLSGGGDLDLNCGDLNVRLGGRANVFAAAADCAYVPRNRVVTVTASGDVKVAFCFARAKGDIAPSVLRAADIPVELRGGGRCSRQVRNFGTPQAMEASSIIACEVITPAGNWSSYPPHKHDEDRPGLESELEEIYYFEIRPVAGAPEHSDAIGYCCVSGTDDRPIDVKELVRSGDVLLVPHGWHGPAMAVPGYDMYYLNVMAGPGQERAWLICDHPSQGWIRQTWQQEPIDPRLPFGS